MIIVSINGIYFKIKDSDYWKLWMLIKTLVIRVCATAISVTINNFVADNDDLQRY